MISEQKRDRISDENADKLRTLMRDELGLVNPNQYIRLTTMTGVRVAIVEPWPVGVDKRRADQLALKAGLKIADACPVSPYGSCYIIFEGDSAS